MGDHAVIVHFDYAADSLDPLYDLEEQLEEAIASAGVGEFDGNEIRDRGRSERRVAVYVRP